MPGEWDFQNQMQFTQSSPIDLGNELVEFQGKSLELANSQRCRLGTKRNSVSAGMGAMGETDPRQDYPASVPFENNNNNKHCAVVNKRLCFGFEYQAQFANTNSGIVQHSPNGFPLNVPGVAQFEIGRQTSDDQSVLPELMGMESTTDNCEKHLRNIPARSSPGVFNFLPGSVESSVGVSHHHQAQVQADKTYKDCYVDYFKPYVNQYGREQQHSMKEDHEMMDQEEMMPPSTPPLASTATNQGQLRATHSPETCRQFLKSGSYSPRTVFEYCRPSACMYPYNSDIY